MEGDLKSLEHQIRELRLRFETYVERTELESEQRMDIEENIKLILLLLRGNELNKSDPGLTGVVTNIENRLKKIEKFKDRAIYWVFGVAFGAGWTISDIISRLSTK